MEGSFLSHALVLVALFIIASRLSSSLASKPDIDYIKTSCNSTTYPILCYNSLSIHATEIKSNPKLLVQTALNITLKATKSTSKMIIKMSKIHGLPREVAAAMADCIEVIGDSTDELKKSIDEMGHIGGNSNFWLIMSDIQTWVSAALTDENTCMDGFQIIKNGNVKTMVRGHVIKLAHLTSNALALINSYASGNLTGSP